MQNQAALPSVLTSQSAQSPSVDPVNQRPATEAGSEAAQPTVASPLPAPPAVDHVPQYRVSDPDEFARNMLRVIEDGGKFVAGIIERSQPQGPTGTGASAPDFTDTTKTLTELSQAWMSDPAKFAEAQGELYRGYMELWNNTLRRLMGEQVEPVAKPLSGDMRFKDADWSDNPYYDYWKQAYLLTTQWAEQTLALTPDLDERTRRKADFLMRQVSASLSPTNFPATNPEVLRETFASNGRNLADGMHQLVVDLEKSGPVLKIRQTDTTAFEVGRDLAVTPGKIIFQNDLFQLIQYTPTTEKVHEIPLLITPPWINKFYILDLTQPKSFVRYAIAQGFTVFVISWVNPDERLKDKGFEDYMREGLLAATGAVMRETQQLKVNVVGYCVGGTLLASTLAYLAARSQAPYASATFLTTQVDFTKAGDLQLFIDEEQLKSIAATMHEKGYLEGSRMASAFNLLRPKDLIWPYVVNNYMLGRKPAPFDLLYWNQDSTRMPEANHNFYLREFYHENKLARGEMTLGGTRLDMKNVTLPVYELAAREDHIAPAESVFIGAKMFGGPVEYVMAGSGHIAGVVNAPDPKKIKYQYWTNGTGIAKASSFQEWVQGATETPGSWWPHWIKWLGAKSGVMVPARKPGSKLGVLEDAPGSYVKAKG